MSSSPGPSPFFNIPFRRLRNPWPPLEIISAEQVEQLHQASMRILEEVGLDFLDDEALDLWQQAGARVDHAARHVWPERGLVLELVARAPAQFAWRARNPERDIVIGSNHIAFAPGGGTVYASNLDIGRRPGTLADFHNLLKLVQLSNVLHLTGEQLIAPQDVPVPVRHLRRSHAIFTLTDKAAMGATHGRVVAADVLNMARLVFGDAFEGEPVIGGVINVNSPLRFDTDMIGGLITFARAGQVVIITPFILAGAMSPITLASALAQQNAETLAGIALAQLVRPGAPVLYGGFTTNVDMKSGSPAFGTPEGAWALLAGAQLARRYGLPYRGSGSLNTSKVADAQAVTETLWTLWPAVMAHTNFVLHSVGWLEGGLTASYEKFVIDQVNLATFARFLQGIDLNQPPGSHSLFWGDDDSWVKEGDKSTLQRAYKLWRSWLAQFEPPALEAAVAEALKEYVARREAELLNG